MTLAEAERWEQLAELLITELKFAAGRPNGSSVPTFLTEHLRRRLWKKEKRQIEEEGRPRAGNDRPEANGNASQCPDCFGTGMVPGRLRQGRRTLPPRDVDCRVC